MFQAFQSICFMKFHFLPISLLLFKLPLFLLSVIKLNNLEYVIVDPVAPTHDMKPLPVCAGGFNTLNTRL